MSTAFYPLGMNPKPSSGYTQQGTYYNKQYIPCKGTGINSFPVGTVPGHIRPLTNKDYGNIFPSKFGLPRPIKHYRKGRAIPSYYTENSLNNDVNITNVDSINYNLNRFVKSGTPGGLINEMIDKPGSFIVKLNTTTTSPLCEGIDIVASYKPNNTNLLDNPESTTQNHVWCCNPEQKAKQRVIYASTNINKKYYSSTKQYLQNRCKTFAQKSFNFASSIPTENAYLSNCHIANQSYDESGPSNSAGCQITVYKPNNHQYAKQGAVSCSTRMLNLNVNTISTNAASIKNYNNTGQQLLTASQLHTGDDTNVMNLLKLKVPECNASRPLNFSKTFPLKNKKYCSYAKNAWM